MANIVVPLALNFLELVAVNTRSGLCEPKVAR